MGYTPEIGAQGFHPPYDVTVAEWAGDSTDFEARGGNREAYYHTAEFVLKGQSHALIEGKGPKRGRVILKKKFQTATSPVLDASGEEGEPILFEDKLRTVARIRKRGRFSYVINPSTRPVVALPKGEQDAGPPSDPLAFAGDATTTTPCADAATEDASCFNDHPFTIPDDPGKSNAEALVRIEWPTEASDWDMTIFRDSDGDGTSVGETEAVGASAQGPSTSEQATIADLEPGENFVVRVVNFAALEPYEGTITFQPPDPFVPAQREKWQLVVKDSKGKVVKRRNLYIERGQTKTLDLRKNKGKKKRK